LRPRGSCWNPQGRSLPTPRCGSPRSRLTATSSPPPAAIAAPGSIEAIALSPDGKLLAATNADTSVSVFDAATGRLRSRFEELDLEAFTLDFTPDSRTLVVGGADKKR
jgi:WD40 repeat protein